MTNRKNRIRKQNYFNYPKRNAKPPSPRETANFMQVLFVSWLSPLLTLGLKRRITEHDLYPTLHDDQADHIGDKLEIMWGNHLKECTNRKKTPSITKLLIKAYAKKFLFFGLFSLAEETIFRMVQVIAIGYVLDFFEGNYLTTKTGTVLFGVGGILLGSIAFLISFHWSMFNMHHVCTHIRLGLSSLIYRKLLHLNQASMRSSAIGQIVTLITADLHRFDRKHVHVNYIWIAPIHLVVVIYVLYFHYNYGVSSLVGLVVLLFFTIIQYFMAKLFLNMRHKRVDSSDQRVRAVVEIINAFYTIKIHCWEKFFQGKARDNRNHEIKLVKSTLFLKLLNTAIGFIVTKMSVFLTLLIAFIFEPLGAIHSKRVFVTLVLYEHVRVNSTVLFPHAINDLAELLASCRRIGKFLLLEELEVNTRTESVLNNLIGPERTPTVQVDNLTCSWNQKEDHFKLKNVSLKATPGDLVVIAGYTDNEQTSGKSTLVTAILGELKPEEGNVVVVGRVAYVSQTPMLFPGSLRRNIIFGYGVNLHWYHEVVKLCGLDIVFEKLPSGDQSLAENTQLSNAQRAKIALARAVYAYADVYILDDPMQSLDPTYHHYFLDNIIRGTLKNKVIILVTHQLQFLEIANRIILINDGEVRNSGTYTELHNEGIEFYKGNEDYDLLQTEQETIEHPVERIQQLVVPELFQPKDLRHRSSLRFELDSKSQVRKVSVAKSINKLSDPFVSPNKQAINEIGLINQDEEAADAEDVVLAPKKLSLRLYYDFLRQGSSRMKMLVLLIVCIFCQVVYTGTDLWIEHWAEHEERRTSQTTKEERITYISTYSGLVLVIVTSSFGRSMLIFRICMQASTAIFDKLLDSTLAAKMESFENTCAGHAINRLSKDMVIIDDLLPPTLLEVQAVLFEIMGTLVILGFAKPIFILAALGFILSNLIVYSIYHLTAADLKRIEGHARSPVYSHLSKTLQGVTTIRAFGQEQAFVLIFDRLQDNHTSSWYLFLAAQSWLAVVVDSISVFLIAIISMSFFYLDKTHPSIVGLSIAKMIELSILVQFAVSEISNTETQMISVERVLEYCYPRPDQFEVLNGSEPPHEWPFMGNIQLTDVCTKLSPISYIRQLKHINLSIRPGEMIGIVGKAGSGKSTLVNTLFRISELQSGTVEIDGMDISSFGLSNMRKRISIIPQNPCMFAGTIRQNIDPMNKFSDEQILGVLKECTMLDAIQRLATGLNTPVTEYGMNFSVGERQFICLARVLLEKSKILICDEPIACLDGLSQMIMMLKLKEHFKGSTIIIVSHKISSIVTSDKLIVMDNGEIVDMGKPLELLKKKMGPFYDLVKHMGPKHHQELIEYAEDQIGMTNSAKASKKSVQRRKSTIQDVTSGGRF